MVSVPKKMSSKEQFRKQLVNMKPRKCTAIISKTQNVVITSELIQYDRRTNERTMLLAQQQV